MKSYEKRIPVEGLFMKNTLNDKVYGWLQVNSFNQSVADTKRTISPKYIIEQERPWTTLFPELDEKRARRKFKEEIKKCIKIGLVKETDYVKGNATIDCYELPFNYEELYYLIPSKTLEYLVNTQSKNAIRIYCYLMFRYQGKKRYTFTQKELIKNVFNNKSTTNESLNIMIQDILDDLQIDGFFSIGNKYISINGMASVVKYFIWVNNNPCKVREYMKEKRQYQISA